MNRSRLPALARALAPALAFTLAFTLATAHAAPPTIDPLCGTRLTAGQTLTLTRDIDCTYYPGTTTEQAAIAIIGNGVTIDGSKPGGGVWKIIAPDAKVGIYVGNVTGATVKNVDVSGWCGGTGVNLNGSVNATLEGVIANSRADGVIATLTSGLVINGLKADGNNSAVSPAGSGLYIDQVASGGTLPKLSNLELTNNLTGLRIRGTLALPFQGPWAINSSGTPSTPGIYGLVTTGSLTGIKLDQYVRNVQFLGTAGNPLLLPNPSFGVDASTANLDGLTFSYVDASGFGAGTTVGGRGLNLAGASNVTIQDVTANDRKYAVYADTLTNLTVRRLNATRAYDAALLITTMTLGPSNALVLDDLRLTYSTRALQLRTITGPVLTPFIIGASTIGTFAGSMTGLYLESGIANVTVQGSPGNLLALKHPTTGIWAAGANNSKLVFEYLDVSGLGSGSSIGGIGIQAAGANVRISNVTADDRQTGVSVASYTNLIVEHLNAARAYTGGLVLGTTTLSNNLTTPNTLTLSDLKLTYSQYGLVLTGIKSVATADATRLVIDDSVLSLRTGNSTSIHLVDSNEALTFQNLTLPEPTYGIYAPGANNKGLVFDTIDFSGVGLGTGLYLRGTNHKLISITANRRVTGVDTDGGGLEIGVSGTGLGASNCVTGLQIGGVTATSTSPVLSKLTLTNNGTGLFLNGFNKTFTLGPAALPPLGQTQDPNVAGSATGLAFQNSSFVTVRNLRLDNPSYGIDATRNSNSSSLVFQGLTLTGSGIGTGLATYGANHQILGVTANRRTYGASVSVPANLLIDGLTASNCRYGLYFASGAAGAAPPTLKNLVLTNDFVALYFWLNATTLTVGPNAWPTPGDPLDPNWALTPDFSGSLTAIITRSSSNLTVQYLTLPNRTAFTYENDSGSNNTLQYLDVSGTGIGTGIALGGGTGHKVLHVVANRRQTGLSAGDTGVQVDDFQASQGANGIVLDSFGVATTPPVLKNVVVTDHDVGITVSASRAPMTIGSASDATLRPVLTGCTTGITIGRDTSDVTIESLTLDNPTGISASSSDNRGRSRLKFQNLNVSGYGTGTGIIVAQGKTLLFQNITANNRAIGISLVGPSQDPTLQTVIADKSVTAVSLGDVTFTAAPVFTGLALTNASTGLSLGTVTMTLPCTLATCSLAIGPSNVTSLAGSPTAIAITTPLTAITANAAALGLTQVGGTYSNTLPAIVAPCGTTLTASLTLSQDLDCTGVTGTALTVGSNGLTIDGAGFKIIAPNASIVIDVGAKSQTTIKNITLSGARAAGTGLRMDGSNVTNGGQDNVVQNVTASYRNTGLDVKAVKNLSVATFTADRNVSTGLYIQSATLPLSLTGMTLTNSGIGLRLASFDGLNGEPGSPTTNFTLSDAKLVSLAGNGTSIRLDGGVKNTRLANLTLTGLAYGLDVRGGTPASGLVLDHVDASGLRTIGYGVYLEDYLGATFVDCTANRRATGFYMRGADNLTLTRMKSDASATGLSLFNTTHTALSVTDLELTNGGLGLDLSNSGYLIGGTKFTFGPTQVKSLLGNSTSVYSQGASNVIVSGLRLDGFSAGYSGNSTNLELRGLNMDGSSGNGFGASITDSFSNALIDNCSANYRATGFWIRGGDQLTLTNITVYGAFSEALSFYSNTFAAGKLTMSNIVAANGNIALRSQGTNFKSTGGGSFLLGPSALSDISGNLYSLYFDSAGAGGANLTFADLRLDGRSGGLAAAGNFPGANVTLDNVDASGSYGNGTGVSSGFGGLKVLNNTRASYRDIGMSLTGAGLQVSNATVNGNVTTGLNVASITLASAADLVLSGLTATNNGTAFRMSNVDATAAPYTIDASLFTSLAGNLKAFDFSTGSVKYVTLGPASGGRWSLPTLSSAISANNGTNARLTYRNLDVSGLVPMPSAYGINGTGVDALVSNVVANHRERGVLGNGSGLSVDGLTADGSGGYGLFLTGGTPTLLKNLTLTNSDVGLNLDASNGGGMVINAASNVVTTGDNTSVRLDNGATNYTFSGIALPGYANGINAQHSATNAIRYTDLDVSSPVPGGAGIQILGPNHVLTRINAWHRNYGVLLQQNGASGLQVDGLDADGADTGFYQTAGVPTLLKNLKLTHTNIALSLAGDVTLDASSNVDTSASFTSVSATNNGAVKNVTLSGLRLTGYTAGLTLTHSQGGNFVFTNLDLSRAPAGATLQCGGNGASIGGNNNVLTNVRAFGRATGLSISDGDRTTVRNGVFGANVSGISVGGASNVPSTTVVTPGVSDVPSANTATTFKVAAASNITAGMTLRIGGSQDRVVQSVGGTGNLFVTLTSALSATPTATTTVQGIVPATTVVADAANTATTFKVANTANITVGQPLRVGSEDRVIASVSGSFVTLTVALSGVPADGTAVTGAAPGSARVTLTNNDVCGNGATLATGGLSAGLVPTAAKVNYWRSPTGPNIAATTTPARVRSDTAGTVGATLDTAGFATVPFDKASVYCNQPPLPAAGVSPAPACEGDFVTLDGSGSSDPDVEALTYAWTQASGQTVTLSGANGVAATFVAPGPAVGQLGATQTLAFDVAVSDDVVTRTASTSVVVGIRNKAPTSLAGNDQTVAEGATVNLAGSGVDPEAQTLSYGWTQVANGAPTVTLVGANGPNASFLTPMIGTGGEPTSATIVLQLTTTDIQAAGYCGGIATGSDTIEIVVNNVNHDPVANAGGDQTVNEGTNVTLSAAASSDPDGDARTYVWTKLSGPALTLTNANSASPSFVAPQQTPHGFSIFVFQVTATDAYGLSSTDTVSVRVEDIVCGDGEIVAPETCDDGNTADGDCCNSNCQFEPVLSHCGNPGDGLCDLQDTCNATGTCVDRVAATTVTCRPDAGACDVAELCDPTGHCPADAFEPVDTACGSSLDSECTNPDSCDGAGACRANDEPTTTNCGSPGSECVIQDMCDGTGDCHDNGFVAATTPCGDPTDSQCTDPDTCNGTGTCLTNNAPALTHCGDAGTECRFQDTCNSGLCVDNGFVAASTPCGDPTNSECTDPDTCNGTGTCLANDEPPTTHCGDSGTDCIQQDKCDGIGDCHDNGFFTAGTACGSPATETCSEPDSCDGSGTCDPNDETLDSDDDDTLDCLDDCPEDPTKVTAGLCGCDIPDTDSDLDEIPDCNDLCPTDATKTDPGACGCNTPDVDTDNDQIIDCDDQCVAGSAQSCAPVPFFLTVRTPTGFGQIACTFDGATLECANTAGIADVTPIDELTSCE